MGGGYFMGYLNVECTECKGKIKLPVTLKTWPGDWVSIKCPHCKKDVEYQMNSVDGLRFSRSYQCPSCGSENIQRLSVIWKGGTSNWDGSAVGVGMGSGGVGGGVALMGGTSQTLLADDAAPPRKVSPWTVLIVLILVLVGSIIIFMGALKNSLPLELDLFLVVFTVSITALYFILNTIRYNTKIYPVEVEKWRNSFLCLRCGAKFIVRT